MSTPSPAASSAPSPSGLQTVRVWDLPTRVFHWLVVALVAALVVTGQIGGDLVPWHFRLGYTVLTLVLFRLVWGFIGGHWSRFGNFLAGPGTILRYLREPAAYAHRLGHNPLGSLSVLALLGMLLVQVGTGLFSTDDIAFSGPLAALVSDATAGKLTFVHKEVTKLVLLALVVLHVAAIVWYARAKGQRLLPAMLHGDKQVPADQAGVASRDGPAQRVVALVVLVACAGVVAWVVSLGG